MEKKETSAAKPLGVCEKLYNALHSSTAFRRPIRIATFRNQDPATTTTTTNNNIEKNQSPQKSRPTPMKPSPAPVKVDIQVEHKLPAKTQVITPPTSMPTTTTRKAAEKFLPTPAPPKAAAVTNAAPLPRPAEPAETKKNINKAATDYIARARAKIRWSGSGVGKTPQS